MFLFYYQAAPAEYNTILITDFGNRIPTSKLETGVTVH